MIQTNYNKVQNILHIIRSGNISAEEILNNLKNLEKEFNYLEDLYILEDLRDSKSSFLDDVYPVFIKKSNQLLKQFNSIQVAFIVENPRDTALSLLFETNVKNLKNCHFSTFNTENSALYWLQKRMEYNYD